MALIITDSTALIGLDRIGHLDLLPAFAPQIIAPPSVIAEFGQHPIWLQERHVENRGMLERIQYQLDAGEAEAIALALETENALLLIDELRGRKYAVHAGIKIVGTFGVILAAKQEGLLSNVKPLLDALIETGFYASERLYLETLRLAGE